jgi:hypothetical protein
LKVLNLGRLKHPSQDDPNRVDSDSPEASSFQLNTVVVHKLLRELSQAAFLVVVDFVKWIKPAGVLARARFNLDDGKLVSLIGNNIYFTKSAAPVDLPDVIALVR